MTYRPMTERQWKMWCSENLRMLELAKAVLDLPTDEEKEEEEN